MIKSKSLIPLLLACLAPLTSDASPDQNLRFKAKLIGSPYINSESGLGGSIPSGINEGGKVVGFYPIFDDAGNFSFLNSFAWSEQDGFEDLGMEPSLDEETGFTRTFVASGINDLGEITGSMKLLEALGENRNRIRESLAFVRRADGSLEIFAPQSPFPGRDGFFDAFGTAINNHGEVAGHERFYDARGLTTELPPIIWGVDGARLVDLNPSEPVLRRSSAFCSDINDQGTITGSTTHYVDGRPRGNEAFIWNVDIGVVRLGSLSESELGQLDSSANALNENEELVGSFSDLTSGANANANAPFYWSAASGMLELPLLDLELTAENQFLTGEANDINDNGVIVGYTSVIEVNAEAPRFVRLESRATIWIDGQAMDLNDLANNLDVVLIGAASINDKGQIAAVAIAETGEVGVLLTPVFQSGLKKGHTDGHPGLK